MAARKKAAVVVVAPSPERRGVCPHSWPTPLLQGRHPEEALKIYLCWKQCGCCSSSVRSSLTCYNYINNSLFVLNVHQNSKHSNRWGTAPWATGLAAVIAAVQCIDWPQRHVLLVVFLRSVLWLFSLGPHFGSLIYPTECIFSSSPLRFRFSLLFFY